MPFNKRSMSSRGGSGGGTITSILAALFGQGGEADPNTAVDADAAPEFEGAFVNPKGQMVDQPFSSRGFNFWDRLSGRSDQAATLNNQVALQQLISSNEGLQQILNQRGLNKVALEQVGPMSEATTGAEVKRRRALIPVGEEEATSKTKSEKRSIEELTPVKGRETATQTYASRGIFPEDVGNLSELTAQNLAAGGENQASISRLIQTVLNDPANLELLKAAALAEKAAPIGALRNALETGVPANTSLYRDAIGNPTLDRLINPGVYTGNIMSQEPAATIPLNINGQTVNMPFGEKTTTVRPGGFRAAPPPFDPNKVSSALDKVRSRVTLSPAESGIQTDPSAASQVKPQGLQPVTPAAPAPAGRPNPLLNEFSNNLIGERGSSALQKILEFLLKGGLTDAVTAPTR